MPIYQYKCDKCGHSEELIQTLSAPVEHDCISCDEKDGMKRTISTVSVSFSGSGWYKDGYQSKTN